jgi:hypothetical protein
MRIRRRIPPMFFLEAGPRGSGGRTHIEDLDGVGVREPERVAAEVVAEPAAVRLVAVAVRSRTEVEVAECARGACRGVGAPRWSLSNAPMVTQQCPNGHSALWPLALADAGDRRKHRKMQSRCDGPSVAAQPRGVDHGPRRRRPCASRDASCRRSHSASLRRAPCPTFEARAAPQPQVTALERRCAT